MKNLINLMMMEFLVKLHSEECLLVLLNMLVTKPAAGLPHLPRTIKDISVKQALSLIASTFDGVVVLGTCRRSNGTGLLEGYFVGLDQ